MRSVDLASISCYAISSLFFVCFWCCGQASAWQDTAIAVADGHTLTVLHDGKKERVRLYGIESPHMRQDFGERARGFTSALVTQKIAEIEPVALDRQGRITDRFGLTVALVYVEGRICLNEELLLAGLAWVHRQSCTRPECRAWHELEKRAKRQRLGLWSLPNPIPPWEFRPNRAAQIPIYHGDIVKHRYHSTNCEEFNCSSCIAVFRGREQAVKAGYHPCSVCNP